MSVQERALKATAAGAFTAFSGALATPIVSSSSFWGPFFVYLMKNPLRAGAAAFAVSIVAETVCNAIEKRWFTAKEENLLSACLKFSLRTVVYLAVGSAAGALIPSIGLTSGGVVGITALMGALLVRICKAVAMFFYRATQPSEFLLAIRAYNNLLGEQKEEFEDVKQAVNLVIKSIGLESEISFRNKMYRIEKPSPNEDNSLDYEKSSQTSRSNLERYSDLLLELGNYPVLPDDVVKAADIRETHRLRDEHHRKLVSSLEKLLEECAVSVNKSENSRKEIQKETILNNN